MSVGDDTTHEIEVLLNESTNVTVLPGFPGSKRLRLLESFSPNITDANLSATADLSEIQCIEFCFENLNLFG